MRTTPVKGIESITSVAPDFSWNRCRDVASVSILRGTDESESRVSIELVSEDLTANVRVRLNCHGVGRLQFNTPSVDSMRLVGLAVENIAHRQMEGLGWRVWDYENGDLELLCRDVDAELVEALR